MVMLCVLSVISYLGGATAFGHVHWGISFTVSVLITLVMSVHTFRYRNLHKVLRRKDFLEEEVAQLIDHRRTSALNSNNEGAVDDRAVEMEHFKRPMSIIEAPSTMNSPSTPMSPMDVEYKSQKLSAGDYGRVKYFCLQLVTEFDIYFRSIELGITKYRVFPFIAYVLFNLFMATWVVSFFYGTCICEHPYKLSTTFTRFVAKKPCKEQNVCALTLNLPENPSSEMIVKFFAVSEPSSAHVLFGLSESSIDDNRVNCTIVDLNQQIRVEKELNGRYVFTCLMKELDPDTEYFFQSIYSTLVVANDTQLANSTSGYVLEDVYSDVKRFKTMPVSPTEVVWVSAGEVGISTRAKSLIKQAASLDPHFIALTGNMAYDSGLLACTNRWVEFLTQYTNNAVTTSGHMIPILTAIGQYEARYHRYGVSRKEILPYLQMFLHNVDERAGKQNTYHRHRLADHTSLTVLDSGVFTSHEDQIDFLNESWTDTVYSSTKKFTMYFHPLYPSYSPSTLEQTVNGLTHWQPVFDNHNVVMSFEGRDRTMKRTVPIRANEENSTGTVYVGDGSFGVMSTNEPDTSRWYIDTAQNVPHLWLVRSSALATSIVAYDSSGGALDFLSLP